VRTPAMKPWGVVGVLVVCLAILLKGGMDLIHPYTTTTDPYKIYDVRDVTRGLQSARPLWVGRTLYVHGIIGEIRFMDRRHQIEQIADIIDPAALRVQPVPPQTLRDNEIVALALSNATSYPRPLLARLPVVGSWLAARLIHLGPHENIIELRIAPRAICGLQWIPLCALGTARPARLH